MAPERVAARTSTSTSTPAELLVKALEDYRESEQAMRRRLQEAMGMNPSDLHALRMIIAARSAGRTLSPKDLADRLGFSSASVTALLNRLERSGHLQREPDESDRRGLVVISTGATDTEMQARLGQMHAGMMDVASSLGPAEAAAVIRTLERLCEALEAPDAP
ncbi:MarR family winged helix-turn-helix transcriptional regulator [Cnuibacter sp. UC19_7]|uniref:MarR family winged helix-turn-helix transcriptional regulator n=1 Tax=Cnuibacter sp. UC19_7 TaxID=3350166 RepID=UPI00366A5CAE